MRLGERLAGEVDIAARQHAPVPGIDPPRHADADGRDARFIQRSARAHRSGPRPATARRPSAAPPRREPRRRRKRARHAHACRLCRRRSPQWPSGMLTPRWRAAGCAGSARGSPGFALSRGSAVFTSMSRCLARSRKTQSFHSARPAITPAAPLAMAISTWPRKVSWSTPADSTDHGTSTAHRGDRRAGLRRAGVGELQHLCAGVEAEPRAAFDQRRGISPCSSALSSPGSA